MTMTKQFNNNNTIKLLPAHWHCHTAISQNRMAAGSIQDDR